jgi:hypothetical protein
MRGLEQGSKNRPLRRASRVVIFAAAFLLLPLAFRAQEETPREYQVKAAFLLNFTKFITWPASEFASADSPFTICILGDDPFKNALDKMVEGELVVGRWMVVLRLQRRQTTGCQEVFLSKSQKALPEGLARPDTGVLTVGETETFLQEGGIIKFVIENRRVRFDVSQAAARRAGLAISSKLLQVARTVETGQP